MSQNAQKTPLGWSLNQFASGKAADAIQLLGKALPCHVVKVNSSGVVTVQFDVKSIYTLPQVEMPVATPEYVRQPTQVGDKGVAFAADAYLGGNSGIGGGTATLVQQANLSTLVFHPFGNAAWFTVDLNALTLYGPNGVVLEDSNKKTVLTLTPTGIVISLQSGDNVTIDGDLHVSGKVYAGYGGVDQVQLQTHVHSGVTSGGGDTNMPVPGT